MTNPCHPGREGHDIKPKAPVTPPPAWFPFCSHGSVRTVCPRSQKHAESSLTGMELHEGLWTLCRFPLCVVSRVSVTLHLLLCNDSRSRSPGTAHFSASPCYMLTRNGPLWTVASRPSQQPRGGGHGGEGYEHFYGFDLLSSNCVKDAFLNPL